MTRTELVAMPDRGVTLEVVVVGDRPDVVLLPSAHRGAADFARLSSSLAGAGYGSVAVNPRRVGRSTGATEGLALRDVADDVAGVVEQVAGRPLHVVGHAQGNVLARATAAYRPECVASVSLLACGGHNLHAAPPSEELVAHFERCGDPTLPDEQRLESLGVVFFAAGNDPSPWLTGWWPAADIRQTLGSDPPEEWATAGRAPVLVVQPLDDPLCPPDVGRDLCRSLGDRGTYREVAGCSHAMLPEQPEAIVELLVEFLDAQPPLAG